MENRSTHAFPKNFDYEIDRELLLDIQGTHLPQSILCQEQNSRKCFLILVSPLSSHSLGIVSLSKSRLKSSAAPSKTSSQSQVGQSQEAYFRQQARTKVDTCKCLNDDTGVNYIPLWL